jgi:signal transduction histidine kinase
MGILYGVAYLKEQAQAHIDHLNRAAWDVRVSDSLQSGKLSEAAITEARAIGYVKGLAEGLRTHGFFQIRQSNHDNAVRCLLEAEQLFKNLGHAEGLSDVSEYRGIVARNLGDHKASLEFLFESLRLRKETGYISGEALSLYHLGVTYRYLGNFSRSLDFFLESIQRAKAAHDWVAEAYSINNIGAIYLENNDADNALHYFQQSLDMREQAGDQWGAAGCLDNIGRCLLLKGDIEQARSFFKDAVQMSDRIGDKKGAANARLHLGEAARTDGNDTEASALAGQCLELRREIGDKKGQSEALLFIASLGNAHTDKDSLEKALSLANATGSLDVISRAHKQLAEFFKEAGDFKNAFMHLEAYQEADRALHSATLAQRIAHMKMEHEVEQSRKASEILQVKNTELAQLVEETKHQKQRAEAALEKLQATQAQLIQAEKMASLGELTAGIAHEIQNPLNFVNNFSEINAELSEEILDAAVKGNLSEIRSLAVDIKSNQEKIREHGKRADAIVKGMLQHSRSSTGVKEPTDIPAMVNEYLRLAYHGMRAKDSAFYASIKTEFAPNLPQVTLVEQDIGRVLLNLFNNAFYAVNEKKKAQDESYEPMVTVSVGFTEGDPGFPAGDPGLRAMGHLQGEKGHPPGENLSSIAIAIGDNGSGIPDAIKAKIFQPFFTTKPTGQGTGLGLSLSYDIVKAHGGVLGVNTREREGTEFIIQLPIQTLT